MSDVVTISIASHICTPVALFTIFVHSSFVNGRKVLSKSFVVFYDFHCSRMAVSDVFAVSGTRFAQSKCGGHNADPPSGG